MPVENVEVVLVKLEREGGKGEEVVVQFLF